MSTGSKLRFRDRLHFKDHLHLTWLDEIQLSPAEILLDPGGLWWTAGPTGHWFTKVGNCPWECQIWDDWDGVSPNFRLQSGREEMPKKRGQPEKYPG